MSKKHAVYIAIALGYMMLLSACSKKQADEIEPVQAITPGVPVTAVTYDGFVGPFFQARCAGCHGAGRQSAAVFLFSGYASVKVNADRIKNAVLVKKSMPVGTPISVADLQSLQAWFDAGMPQ